MNIELDDVQRLRRAFQEGTGPAPAGGADCPAAEALIDAEAGRLERQQLSEVLEHLARCPACTDAWRLAAGMRQPAVPHGRTDPLPIRRRRRWIEPLVAVAACLAIIVGIGLRDSADTTRSTTGERIAIEVDDDVALDDLDDSGLATSWRWQGSAVPDLDGIAYRVSVRDARSDLDLYRGEKITETTYDVPGPALAEAIRTVGTAGLGQVEVCVEASRSLKVLAKHCRTVSLRGR